MDESSIAILNVLPIDENMKTGSAVHTFEPNLQTRFLNIRSLCFR